MEWTALKTVGELEKSGYTSRSIKDELRTNLQEKLVNKEPIFEGIIGYEDTVIPQLIRAILSKHDINLLGLRGQAKTRIARSMIQLLDEFIPIIAGSDINDDPFCPISHYGKSLKAEKGKDTPIEWVHRSERFFEKLATPDVTVADLIGDIDPIKAATLKLSYADERVIHYGMIPRANRCIFVINEIPDLQARIQVALFNILQEGDIQIRGFKMRLPLDVNFIFTANPEDYTNRGSIVTPLKDRIGSQILTHYPLSIEIAKQITAQEVIQEVKNDNIIVPELAKTLLEQIVFEARESTYIDANSGVSARMSITMYENLVSAAQLRMLKNGEKKTVVRLSDFEAIIPSITGKVELVYEGEQLGAEQVAHQLIGSAIKTLFNEEFRPIKKLKKPGVSDEFDSIVQWFLETENFELITEADDKKYVEQLNQITPLNAVIDQYHPTSDVVERTFLKELLLWGLVEYQLLSKYKNPAGISFADEILGSIYGRE
ncbi:AAA family ATPase [Crocinitomicaceae bacterium]|nr:AAA family ATPase [Crocinitomicaceae bacterium]